MAARAGAFSSGPIGANGLRPQLAWGAGRTGNTDTAPTRRVPGASMAAAAQAATAGAASATKATPPRGDAPPAGAAARGAATSCASASKPSDAAAPWGRALEARSDDRGQAKPEGGRISAAMDSEGFQMVRRRGARGRRDIEDEGWDGEGPAAAPRHGVARAGGEARGEVRADGGHTRVCEDGDGDDAGEEEEDWATDDPAALRRRLDQEEATVKMLARGGLQPHHPTMAAAVATRDDAAAAWRAARKPHPVGKRMGWAQQKYDKALNALERAQAELQHFDDQVKAQRDKLIEKRQQAREKVARQRQELEDLQEEAGAEVSSARRGRGGEVLCARLADGMRGTVAPNVAALAAQLDEGSEAHRQVCLLMGHLQGLQSELEAHAGGDQEDVNHHQSFDIADDDVHSEQDWQWSETHGLGDEQDDAMEEETMGHPTGSGAATPMWKPEGHGRWGKDGPRNTRQGPQAGKGVGCSGSPADTQDGEAAADGRRGTSEAQAHAANRSVATGVCTEGGMRRQESADQAAATPAGRNASTRGAEKGRETTSDEESRPNKSRRGQASEDTADAISAVQNTARAVELLQDQKAAAEAGAFGTEAAVQAAAQVHAKEVARISAVAISRGVQPITEDGEDLIMLGPQALARWAEAYLGATA